jgi:hypothetical protein
MTPVDAFDTMILMGLTAEATEAKDLILSRLNFDLDMEVQHFEVTIRILGGLISAQQLEGDPAFLSSPLTSPTACSPPSTPTPACPIASST